MVENKRSKGGMWVFWLIVLIGALPIVAAWYLVKHPGVWGTPGNRGTLIQPPLKLDYAVLKAVNGVSVAPKSLQEIRGRWVMIHILFSKGEKSCRQSLEDTKRLHPLFSKDIPRVRRLAVWRESNPPLVLGVNWLSKDRDLYIAQISEETYRWLEKEAVKAPLRCGQVLLMDPLGNLMMWYDSGFDPYGLYHDLKRLLRASRIG